MTASAPGKLILCGEHAVVYGRPALAMAVDRFTECRVQGVEDDAVYLNLTDLQHPSVWRPQQLLHHSREILKRYSLFQQGQLPIRRVAQRSSDVPAYLIELIHRLKQAWQPCRIDICSTIPIGSGMGSSASLLTSMALALLHFCGNEISSNDLQELVMAGERLYHGHPSGVDAWLTIHGGMVRFQHGEAKPLPLLTRPLYLVHTGKPESSTGECVQYVRQQHGHSAIWQEFEQVCDRFETAIIRSQPESLLEAVRSNHRLLVQLGVVPAPVREFIAGIESAGGAAKISGAGAIAGPAAGMVLVFSDEPPAELCRLNNYPLITVHTDEHGCRIA